MIGEKKTKMEDISHCFLFYPQFYIDFEILYKKGIIERITFDKYKWTKTATSLAEYFKWIADSNLCGVTGGFWSPIEKVFKINKRTLSKLASRNSDPWKQEISKDFKIIKEVVSQHREELAKRQKYKSAFADIEEIIKKTSNEVDEIQKAIKEIKKICSNL